MNLKGAETYKYLGSPQNTLGDTVKTQSPRGWEKVPEEGCPCFKVWSVQNSEIWLFFFQCLNGLSPFKGVLHCLLMSFKSCLIFPFCNFKGNTYLWQLTPAAFGANCQLTCFEQHGMGQGWQAEHLFSLAHHFGIDSIFKNLNIENNILKSRVFP